MDQTLYCTKAPYVVVQSVPTITHKLTIEPGVTIKFDKYSNYGSGFVVASNGEIDAEGTAAQPITFTSIKDGSGATPAAGDWWGISLGSSSSSKFSYCVFKYPETPTTRLSRWERAATTASRTVRSQITCTGSICATSGRDHGKR